MKMVSRAAIVALMVGVFAPGVKTVHVTLTVANFDDGASLSRQPSLRATHETHSRMLNFARIQKWGEGGTFPTAHTNQLHAIPTLLALG